MSTPSLAVDSSSSCCAIGFRKLASICNGAPTTKQSNQDETEAENVMNVGADSGILVDVAVAWKQVPGDGENTPLALFLEASAATVKIFDCLGSTVAAVKADMQNNIDILRRNLETSSCQTLEEMVEVDVANGVATRKNSTAECMLWLARFERLLEKTLTDIRSNANQSLSQCIRSAYDSVLAQHHPMPTRSLIRGGIKLAPDRKEFFAKLGISSSLAGKMIDDVLHEYSPAMNKVQKFLLEQKLEKPDK